MQEGLSRDITFNGLHCHLLVHVLPFIYSWESNRFPSQMMARDDIILREAYQRKLTAKLALSDNLSHFELCDIQQPSSWRGDRTVLQTCFHNHYYYV